MQVKRQKPDTYGWWFWDSIKLNLKQHPHLHSGFCLLKINLQRRRFFFRLKNW